MLTANNEAALTDTSVNFAGLWLPLITPFRDGQLDIPAVQSLACYYSASGISGLVLFGSTGEGNLITLDEKSRIVNAVREAAPQMPIVLGAGAVDTRTMCLGIRKLDRLKPDGWLVPPPYYLCPAADGIVWHYKEVAWATKRPIIIYNIPKRTGTVLSVELMEHLCQYTSCVAVKECDPIVLSAMNARRKINALCGEDMAFFDHCLQGGSGAISASAHIRPDIFVAVMTLTKLGHHDDAAMLFASLKPMIRLLFQEPNPSPIKQVLASLGVSTNEVRLPMTPVSEALAKRLGQVLARLPSTEDVAAHLARSRADARLQTE